MITTRVTTWLKRCYATLLAVFLISLTNTDKASADGHWLNDCDPQQELRACAVLAMSYQQGIDPFPIDTDRAAALRMDTLRVAGRA